MTGPTFEYVGSELDLFSQAHTWRSYWASKVRPFLGSRILEVGAGIGSVTRLLYEPSKAWTALEPDPTLASRIDLTFSASHQIDVKVGSLQTFEPDAEFDSILYVDVLEHIEKDRDELRMAYDVLAEGGFLIVLAPAHQWLFTPFDSSIGHYRRYSRKSIRALTPVGAKEASALYLDSAGMLASSANRMLLKSANPTRQQIQFWDQRLVPISRRLDRLLGHHVGKSVLMVWEKPTAVRNLS